MPELPEVETIRRELEAELPGRTIAKAQVLYAGSVREKGESFAAKVTGRSITGLRRRGKLLLVDFDDGSHMAVHLKMSGRLMVWPEHTAPDKHTHVVLTLDDGRELHFHDVRKFGYCVALTTCELEKMEFFRTLGREPLELSAEEFADLFSGRRGAIKSLLLNQKFLAGVGNIYADESLFRAGIHPSAPADKLSRQRLLRLHASLTEVLHEAIAANGSSINDYRTARGDAGAFQNAFRVYGREGEPCAHCKGKLKAAKIAGRTSTFCPKCQRM